MHTVGVGVAIGQSCMLLSAGEKGKRFMLEHATAMLHQPRVPPTGQRQAIEIQIKWREVGVWAPLCLLRMLSLPCWGFWGSSLLLYPCICLPCPA